MTKVMRFYKRLLDLSLSISYILLLLLLGLLAFGVSVEALNFSEPELPLIVDNYSYLRPIFIVLIAGILISVIAARVFLGYVSKNEALESVEDYKRSMRKNRKDNIMNQLKLDIQDNELTYDANKYLTKKERKRLKDQERYKEIDEQPEDEIETTAIEAIVADRGVRISDINDEEIVDKEEVIETIEVVETEDVVSEPEVEEDIVETEQTNVSEHKVDQTFDDYDNETIQDETIQEKVIVTEKPKPSKKRSYYTRLTKSELVEIIADELQVSNYRARKFVNALLSTIQEQLVIGNDVRIEDFGKFSKHFVERHQAIDPRNGDPVTVPAHYVAKFKPFTAFKDKITNDVSATNHSYFVTDEEAETMKKYEDKKEEPKTENVVKKAKKPTTIKRTKKDVIQYIHNTTKLSKNKANKFLLTMADVVKESLEHNTDVNIEGFGRFTTIHLPSKEAVNPSTKEKMIVPEHNQVRLRFDEDFKSKFN